MARKEVVRLQAGDEETLTAWRLLCAQSRREFDKIYNTLGVTIEERGESFYNPYLNDVIKDLNEQGIAEENEGAQVVFVEG